MRAFASVLALALAASPARAEIYGLIIGVDDYKHVPSLSGAVNDARDLAGVLTDRGAEVTLLLDAEASRDRIVSEFRNLARSAKSGDTIVFSYAGHGVQLPEALPGDETDGLDETYILHGFEVQGPGFAERIRDNDIADLLREVKPDVAVLMVADSCHSGTMTRAVDPRGSLGRSRYVAVGPVTAEDTLAKPRESTRTLDASDFPNVVFANAARDDQQTPEVQIDGDYRGALSWSVARALEGAADGGDGATSLTDFSQFVVEQVRALSGTRQTPGVRYSQGGAVTRGGLSALFGSEPEPQAADPLALAEAPSLFIRGSSETRAVFLAGIKISQTEETARLLWDTGAGELVDRATADVIAEVSDAPAVEEAVVKWRAVQPLIDWVPRRPVAFRLEPDDGRHKLGDNIHITVAQPSPDFRYVTIVNLASTGEVQFIFPSAQFIAAGRDKIEPEQGEIRLGPAPVSLPIGSDHVIALVSRSRLDSLHFALDDLHGTIAPEALLDLLKAYAGDAAQVRAGLLPIFTER